MIEPTGYTALDLVGFTDKGPYAANVNYVKNDLVHHGGNIWRVLIDDTIGITPAEGPNYTVFVGEPINLVERIIAPLEDNPATVAYQTGRQIIYNDHLYEVIQNIGVGDILIAYEDDPTNANIKLASPVETQVLALNASKVNKSDIANNVTTTTAGKVLDASQGKVLQDGINTKVNTSDVVNNVTTTTAGKVLDARQGKVLQDGINTVETQVLALDTRLTAAEEDIVELNDKIDYINDKKILLISDSYGVDAYTGGESWITKTINRMPSRSFVRSQTGGAGFGYDATNPLYFPNVFSGLTADETIGMILILCGANDGNLLFGGTTTENLITAGIQAGQHILNQKFPNADIHIGFVGRYRERARFKAYKQARNVYRRTCMSIGVTYADNFEYVLHNRNLLNSTDLVHPTSDGSLLISWYAAQYIIKKSVDVYEEASESGVGTNNIKLKSIVHNGLTTLIITSSGDTNLMNMTIGGEATAGDINKTFTYDYSSLICDPVDYRSQAVQGQWVVGGQSVFLATIAYILNGKYTCTLTKPSGSYGGTYASFYHLLPQFMYDSMDC